MFHTPKPQPRTLESLSKIYPRPSPYNESNLHKFGTGPSSTILPVQNEIPVFQRRLNLNSQEYYRRADDVKGPVCYCCLEVVEQDFIDNLDRYLS